MTFDKEGNIETKNVKFIPVWMDDPKIRTYHIMDFLPPPQPCPSNVYNLWKGFAIDHQIIENNRKPLI